jgi:hypothetical protein
LLVVDGDSALVIEIKRTLATEVEKTILDAESAIEVLSKLSKAYSQCKTSDQRKPWRSDRIGRNIQHTEAIILVDDSVVAEGGILAMLLYELGAVSPRFETMSLSSFEDMIAVLGVRNSTLVIRQKWLTGNCDMPLAQYCRTVQGRARVTVPNARRLLETMSREIFGTLRIGDFDASWP